jgi:hypothetical protein
MTPLSRHWSIKACPEVASQLGVQSLESDTTLQFNQKIAIESSKHPASSWPKVATTELPVHVKPYVVCIARP